MRNSGLGSGDSLDRSSFLSNTQPKVNRQIFSVDVSYLWKRIYPCPAHASDKRMLRHQKRSYLHRMHISGRIYKRHNTQEIRCLPLGLQQESLEPSGSHPSGLCPRLVPGGTSVRTPANEVIFKKLFTRNKLNFPPPSCILVHSI